MFREYFFINSSCCPSLFDENKKDIPKRRNIRKARGNKEKKNDFFSLVPSLFQERVRVSYMELENVDFTEF